VIRAILAHDAFWGIGKDGDLPWPKNSDDLKWFKEKTTGGVVVMGRKTWESLPVKPLPNRKNIVCSTKDLSHFPGADSVMNINEIVQTLPYISGGDKWVIGGATLLESCLPIIDELWFNDVGGDYNCDIFLPKKEIARQFHMGSVEVLSFGIVTKWIRRKDATIS
jgi:dihydrofolate reductase